MVTLIQEKEMSVVCFIIFFVSFFFFAFVFVFISQARSQIMFNHESDPVWYGSRDNHKV